MNTVPAAPIDTERHGRGFLFGFFTGAAVGVGLALWFAPRLAKELKERVSDTAKAAGELAADRYDQISTSVGDVAKTVTGSVNAVRHDVAEAVAHGAHAVEEFATSAKGR
jgi:gas vesicle protein